MAGKLAPSLKLIWPELDAKWPNRDRRTDGWYASPSTRTSKGHNPGHNGYSHAVDVDKDGINPLWIIDNIVKDDKVLWYIIWNRTLYSNTYNWKPRKYTGSNPHTDHMHIEIYQTNYAEQWKGPWGIKPQRGIITPPDDDNPGGSPGGSYGGDFGTNYGGRDYRGHLVGLGQSFDSGGTALNAAARAFTSLRK